VFVKVGSDLIIYVLILTVSQLFGHVITWPYLRGKIKYSYPKFRTITPIILPIVILFIPNVAVSLYKYIDKIMLGYYSPKDQLGYYEYASIIVGLPLGFITSLGTIMMPKSTELHRDGNTSKNLEYIRHSMIYSLGLSIAFSYGLAAISNTFVPFYFGDSFLPTSQLITGLALTLPFLSWANVIRTQYLIPKGKDKEYILSLFGGAAINLIINAILIPKYMAWGAVIVTIAAEITVCLIQTLIVKKDLPIKMYLMEGSGFILIGLLMLVVTNFINQMEISSLTRLVLMIVVGILIYLPLSLLYVKFGLKVRINNILK
jgi:O-antigen/teichoic acid export membrane protein